VLAVSVDALAGVATWLYLAVAVAVSAVGVVTLRRRHSILSDARNRRKEAIVRVLSGELKGSQTSEQHLEQEQRLRQREDDHRGPLAD